MGELHETAAALRISGDDLDPDEVTALLGRPPSLSYRKGDRHTLKNGRDAAPRRRGAWMLDADDRSPGDLDGQIEELLSGLTDDLTVWKALSGRFEMDLFCGFFMKEGSEGIGLRPGTLEALGSRGIELGICLYAPAWRDLQKIEEELEREHRDMSEHP